MRKPVVKGKLYDMTSDEKDRGARLLNIIKASGTKCVTVFMITAADINITFYNTAVTIKGILSDLILSHLSKSIACIHNRCFTWLYVLSNNADVCVPVGTCVFMPEADHMTEFVNNNSKFIAVLANGDSLGSITSPTHIRTTSTKKKH